MTKCDVFVCLLADQTLSSAWVRDEIRFAHELRLPMIPVFQESWRAPDEPLDESLRSLLHYDGVQLLDEQNIFIDGTVKLLAERIRGPIED